MRTGTLREAAIWPPEGGPQCDSGRRKLSVGSPKSRSTPAPRLPVAGAHSVRPSQSFEWRRAYKEGRLDGDSETPTLLPVRLSDVSPPTRLSPSQSLISIELAHDRIDIHGSADPATLGIVLECLPP